MLFSLKKQELLTHAIIWVRLKDITLSETLVIKGQML